MRPLTVLLCNGVNPTSAQRTDFEVQFGHDESEVAARLLTFFNRILSLHLQIVSIF